MKTMSRIFILLLSALLLGTAGCSSTTSISIEHSFPVANISPLPINATVVFSDEFKNYVATPNKKTSINLGEAQTQLLTNIFSQLFESTDFVTTADQADNNVDFIIAMDVHEVQISSPSTTYLNVFEVWIKYNLHISTAKGELLTSWFMPAYGKTPDSFMLSKSTAIQEATIVALRDIGANLALGFNKIPAVNHWLSERAEKRESP